MLAEEKIVKQFRDDELSNSIAYRASVSSLQRNFIRERNCHAVYKPCAMTETFPCQVSKYFLQPPVIALCRVQLKSINRREPLEKLLASPLDSIRSSFSLINFRNLRGDCTSLEQPSNHPKYYYRSSRPVFIIRSSNQPSRSPKKLSTYVRTYVQRRSADLLSIRHASRSSARSIGVSVRITLSIVGGFSNEPSTRIALIALDRHKEKHNVALHAPLVDCSPVGSLETRRGTKLVETNPECSFLT